MPEATAPASRWRIFRSPDTAGAIYGTIVAMAAIAGAARNPAHGRVLALTVATLAVFWLAHVYAHALAHHLRGTKQLDWPAIRAAMAEERALLEGPLPMLVLLVCGRIGLLAERLAMTLALWAGVAQLVGLGACLRAPPGLGLADRGHRRRGERDVRAGHRGARGPHPLKTASSVRRTPAGSCELRGSYAAGWSRRWPRPRRSKAANTSVKP
jgi:hypothetical protein